MEWDKRNVRDTALRMRRNYANSTYTALDRAIDHAMSHDQGTPGREFWHAVCEVLDAMSGGGKLDEK